MDKGWFIKSNIFLFYWLVQSVFLCDLFMHQMNLKTTTKFLIGETFVILKWYCIMMAYFLLKGFLV